MEHSEGRINSDIDACRDQLLEHMNSGGWEELGEDNEVYTQRKGTDTGIFLVKSQGFIPATPSAIVDYIWDNSKKSQWDDMLEETTILNYFSDELKILREQFWAPWPLSHREFIFIVKRYNEANGVLLTAKSVEVEAPVPDGIVRGELMISGWFLEPVEGGSQATYLINADPKGLIPLFVINLLSKRQGQNIYRIRNQFKQQS